MSAVIDLDELLAAHVAAAMSLWSQRLRRDQVALPEGFAELLAFATRRAQARPGAPLVDDFARVADARPVTLMVTKADAARVLALSRRTVDRLVAAGQLPAVKVGEATRVRVADLEAYVKTLIPVRSTP